jgi:Raf kinase inhibitor-like YbhB/YbcL family protein
MRKILASVVTVLATAGVVHAAPFALTSTAFKSGGNIAQTNAGNIMGCTGDNKSPALEWKNPPAGTKSFALLVHDPDAPTGGAGFWHWIVYNIPADTTSLPEGAGDPSGAGLPKGAVQGNTDVGKPGYVGPCPPPGSPKHRYNFVLYPLKVDNLEVPPSATAAIVGFTVNANVIGKPAKLTGVYARPKEPAAPKTAEPAKDAAKPATPPPAGPAPGSSAPAPKPPMPPK